MYTLAGMNLFPYEKGTNALFKKARHGAPTKELVADLHLACLALFLGFVLRTLWLNQQELWFDEVASAYIATKSITGIFSYIQGQLLEHPPVYYILLHGWILLVGTSEFALRFFSVFFGVVFLSLLWALAKPFGTRTLSLATIFMAAVFPFQVLQSQEARMYTLVACFGALAILTFYKVLESKGYWWWVAWGAVTVIGTGTHYYFPLLPLAQVTYLACNLRAFPNTLLRWIPAISFIAISPLVAWLTFSKGPRETVVRSFLSWAPATTNIEDIKKLGVETVFGTSDIMSSPAVGQAGTVMVLAIAVAGILFGRRCIADISTSGISTPKLLQTPLVFAVALPILVGLLMPHNLVARYLTFADAALYLLIGLGIATIRLRYKFAFLIPLILVFGVFGYGNYYLHYIANNGEFGAGTRIIHSDSLPEDAIVLTHPDQWPFVNYYMSDDAEASRVFYVPIVAQPVSDVEVNKEMTKIASTHSRIWLGPINPASMDPQSKVENWLLRNTYRSFKQWLPKSSSVSLFFQSKSPMEIRPVNYLVGSSLELQGYALSEEIVRPSWGVPIRLLWKERPEFDPGSQIQEGLKLIDENGRVWSLMTDPISSDTNQPDTKRALYIPPGTPPGKYKIVLSVYLPGEGQNLLFFDNATNQVLGPTLTLGSIEVSRSNRPSPMPKAASPTKGVFNGEIELLGSESKSGRYRQGEELSLALFWHVLKPPQHDYLALIAIVDGDGRPVYEIQRPMISTEHNSVNWQAGEYLKGIYDIPIPAGLPGGRYEIRFALKNSGTGLLAAVNEERITEAFWGLWKRQEQIKGDSLGILDFDVDELDRDFKAPNVASPSKENLGDQIAFIGHNTLPSTAKAGDTLSLTLYWQATHAITDSYKVFAHLLNEKGVVVAQQDIVPKNGNYPTNLWVPGEYVEDDHSITLPSDLPPGQYVVEIGMYDFDTLTRLPVMGSAGEKKDDRILLPSVTVVE